MPLISLSTFDDYDPTIDDLEAGTIGLVAARTAQSSGFSELIYRECEINALWSLADIALSQASRRSAPVTEVDESLLSRAMLARLRELFEEAYLLLARSHTVEASQVLTRAATMSSPR